MTLEVPIVYRKREGERANGLANTSSATQERPNVQSHKVKNGK